MKTNKDKQLGIPTVTIALPWMFGTVPEIIYKSYEAYTKKQLRLDILEDLGLKRLPNGVGKQIRNFFTNGRIIS